MDLLRSGEGVWGEGGFCGGRGEGKNKYLHHSCSPSLTTFTLFQSCLRWPRESLLFFWGTLKRTLCSCHPMDCQFWEYRGCGFLIKGIGHGGSSVVPFCGSIGSRNCWEGLWQESKIMVPLYRRKYLPPNTWHHTEISNMTACVLGGGFFT